MTVDKTIPCRDCGQQFVFSAREQEFFAERGFGDPVRCLNCRREHKARKLAGADGAAPGPDRGSDRGPDRGADRGGRPAPSGRGDFPSRPEGPRGSDGPPPRTDSRDRRPAGDERAPYVPRTEYSQPDAGPRTGSDWNVGGREDGAREGGGRGKKEKRRGRDARGWGEEDQDY